MTKDNLLKRNNVKPLYCALCEEHESINHMFFDCVVAKVNLNELSEYCKVHIGCNYESVAKFWISSKKKCCFELCCCCNLMELMELSK